MSQNYLTINEEVTIFLLFDVFSAFFPTRKKQSHHNIPLKIQISVISYETISYNQFLLALISREHPTI